MAPSEAIQVATAALTPASDRSPTAVAVDDAARLRQIRALVTANNRSSMDTDTIICQIYMESRFDANASAAGSSAKGLMQLLRVPVRELYRLDELDKPRRERRTDAIVFAEADRFHDGPDLSDEATNIQTGTRYLEHLIRKRTAHGDADPIAEAYKDYRGVRNGIYYTKIKRAAERLRSNPESMQILREMVQ